VHRDVKPENIFWYEGRALLADFGIARVDRPNRSSQALTVTGTIVGTVAYMSPEQGAGTWPRCWRAPSRRIPSSIAARPGSCPTASSFSWPSWVSGSRPWIGSSARTTAAQGASVGS